MLKKKIKKIIIIIFIFLILLTLGIAIAFGVLWGIGPFGFILKNKVNNMPGNADEYAVENIQPLEDSPLKGKKLCFLGSSVTKGENAKDNSFADYIGKRNQCEYVKEAVSGTTLVDNGSNSYVQRMQNKIDKNENFDVFICQLSTNDATMKNPMGEISESRDRKEFDTSTIIGATEYIISYSQETWGCPVIFYTGTRYDNEQYGQMVDMLYELQDKWSIGIIDLWNNEEMNAVSEGNYNFYMSDNIHPTRAGYLEWWTPVIEQYLYENL